jgi:hypothetical protein
MPNQLKQEGSFNIAVQHVDKGGTVNITQVVNNSDYEKCKADLERERKYFSELEEGEIEERLKTGQRIANLERQIQEYQDYFYAISKELERTKNFDSKRLEEARSLFGNGEIDKAREYYAIRKHELFEEEKQTNKKRNYR